MKFICEKEKLLIGLNYVTRSSVGRTTDPILEGILINIKENKLILTTNDLDIGMEYIINECNIFEEGKTVVDCKMFNEIIRKMPNSEITIFINENKLLVIECEGSIYKLSTMNADEFQTLPTINVEKSIAISQKLFKDMVKKSLFAVSTDENRPIFTGCLFEVNDNRLFIVAIDGFRLALRKSVIIDGSQDFSAIIPGKYLNEIIKNIGEDEKEIIIGISKNQALFEFNDCKIVTRLLEGEFLNYNNVIPNSRETRVKVKKENIQSAIERASIFSITAGEKEKKYPIKMYINLENIIVSCTSQVGDAKEEILVETEGKELEIGFNPKYLLDVFKNIEDDEIYMDFGSNISPCIIRPTVEDKFIYMVSPIRLKE